jgi:hypothetical protein
MDSKIGEQADFSSLRIHGQVYHYQASIERHNLETAVFASLYFYDPEMANAKRTYNNHNTDMSRAPLDPNTVKEIHEVMEACNKYIPIYKTAYEALDLDPVSSIQPSSQDRVFLDIDMQMVLQKGTDKRTFNLPRETAEIGGFLPYSFGAPGEDRVIAEIALRGGGYRAIKHHQTIGHPAYNELAYPLIFPYGPLSSYSRRERLALTKANGEPKNASLQDYFRYFLQVREGEFNPVHHAGRLGQAFMIDGFIQIEDYNLNWYLIPKNQQQIRATDYRTLEDSLAQPDTTIQGGNLGHKIIVSPSFHGGDRWMQKLYLNSMAIVATFGKPTFFITVTANPDWPEIKENIHPWQKAIDRPDIVARVFRLKIEQAVHELKKGVMGEYRGLVRTIEYQKRGLPHCHLLLWVKDSHHFNDPEYLDRFISAELPDPEAEPELYRVVSRHMVHGPCGIYNTKLPCTEVNPDTKQAHCTKGFPFPYREQTEIRPKFEPLYRRRRNPDSQRGIEKVTASKETIFLDNRHIAPYNAYLLLRFNCHTNVKLCSTIECVKYIHKYIYKGQDKATMEFLKKYPNEIGNEVLMHTTGRYVGPQQACWGIFGFHDHEEDPPVKVLDIHDEKRHQVRFEEDATVTDLQQALDCSTSTLLAWFEYNRRNSDGRRYYYTQFPNFYVYKKGKWHRRTRRSFAIGRMHHVSPRAGDVFFLAELLRTVPGATSFVDIRTFNGVKYPSFRGAAEARGLCEHDEIWKHTFDECVVFQHDQALRSLFIIAVTNGADAPHLWEIYGPQMCYDLQRRISQRRNIPVDELAHVDYGLYLVHEDLRNLNIDPESLNLPQPIHDWQSLIADEGLRDHFYDEEGQAKEYQTMFNVFNPSQLSVFNQIRTSIDNEPSTAHFFLQGPAGTGKTFVYKTLAAYYRSQRRVVLTVAASGIAASILPGGRTAHSAFSIPPNAHSGTNLRVGRGTRLGRILKETFLIIWDEVPMQNRYDIEAVNRLLQDIRGRDDRLFGGVPVVFGGDFAQIPPVVKPKEHSGTIRSLCFNASLRSSPIFKRLTVLQLTQNMRVSSLAVDQIYGQWIRQIPYNSVWYDSFPPPKFLKIYDDLEEFIEAVYPTSKLSAPEKDPDFFSNRAILASTNALINQHNEEIANRLPLSPTGNPWIYLCKDTVFGDDSETQAYPPEYLAGINDGSLQPSRLELKPEALVMVIRNINPAAGLVNGTKLRVKACNPNSIVTQVVGGRFDGEERFIPRILLTSDASEQHPGVTLRRLQFPIRLCFAITINKSQGQTIKTVGIDLRDRIFSHGQLYVALSRVQSVKDLHILLPGTPGIEPNLTNEVWPELLLDLPNNNLEMINKKQLEDRVLLESIYTRGA